MHQQGFNAYMTKPIDEKMLSHIIYEYCDVENFINTDTPIQTTDTPLPTNDQNAIINWSLALKRSAGKESLAQAMLVGLVDGLDETRNDVISAVEEGDGDKLKSLIHKLNGACCYTGTPNLALIVNQLETQLKQGVSANDLEPEFLEFFEHIEQLIYHAPNVLKNDKKTNSSI